ncbi:hypothetical protein C8J56DRAFT_1072598 [Mycena floridula]|nr:hypothetical protein C8J56DRAFT_1072598 [Mycena floridula]
MKVSEEVAKPGESESDSEESDVDGPTVDEGWNNPGDAGASERRGFDAVANHLEDRAADNDESDWDDDPDSDVPVSTLGNGQKVHLYFGKTVISLTDLFNWAVIDAEHHDFWVQGKANYDEETTFYELLSRTSTDEPPPGEASAALLPVSAENAIEIDGYLNRSNDQNDPKGIKGYKPGPMAAGFEAAPNTGCTATEDVNGLRTIAALYLR